MTYEEGTVQFLKGLSGIEREIPFEEYVKHFIDDEEELREKLSHLKYFTQPMTVLRKMRPIFHETEDVQWNQINSVPIYDEDGKPGRRFRTDPQHDEVHPSTGET